jgi:hypothetical protein
MSDMMRHVRHSGSCCRAHRHPGKDGIGYRSKEKELTQNEIVMETTPDVELPRLDDEGYYGEFYEDDRRLQYRTETNAEDEARLAP